MAKRVKRTYQCDGWFTGAHEVAEPPTAVTREAGTANAYQLLLCRSCMPLFNEWQRKKLEILRKLRQRNETGDSRTTTD